MEARTGQSVYVIFTMLGLCASSDFTFGGFAMTAKGPSVAEISSIARCRASPAAMASALPLSWRDCYHFIASTLDATILLPCFT